ncbi:hypothetical protein CHS0354_004205 [Potamilus streckersoni]|uniref:Mitochondria-eating protein n=1 Tax=Potamilus streckersoni TaxID=2493646 RepID=A0AAE0RRR9_9BIVA|nr:hypothetical protein CHS0354_004205 [Potamilus streckersoni]
MTNSYDVENQAFKEETDEQTPGNSKSWWSGWWSSQTPDSCRIQRASLTQQTIPEMSTNSRSWWRNWWPTHTPESYHDQRQSLTQESNVKAYANWSSWWRNWWPSQTPESGCDQTQILNQQNHAEISAYSRSWWRNWWPRQTPKSGRDQAQILNQQNHAEISAYSGDKDEDAYTCTEELKRKLNEAEKERDENRMIISNQKETITQLSFQIFTLKQDFEALKKEKQSLLTRLSQISSAQLTEGNPNIADLSDPNRQDKLAEQMSELYDNQWTESFQVLCETRRLQEELAINLLLKIIMTTYDECRSHADKQYRKLTESICSFTGVEVVDSTSESIIRESIHNLRNYRAKHFAAGMADTRKKVDDSLLRFIGSDLCSVCQVYIDECTKVCWLMCIKSPPMYISTKTTEEFDHNFYTSYTKSGKRVSYVVWPTLFQYENGPVMKKGVAQGIN